MPVKSSSVVNTGVATAQIVKAAKERNMSQPDAVERELAELEALQDGVPMAEDEDVDAALAALAEVGGAEEEDVEAELAALANAEDVQEEEASGGQPTDESGAAQAAAPVELEAGNKPTSAPAEEPAPAPAPEHATAPAAAGSGGATVNKLQLGKRKPGLFVKKAEPKLAAKPAPAPASGPKPVAAKPPALKKTVKARPAPPEEEAAAEAPMEVEAPAEDAATAEDKENVTPAEANAAQEVQAPAQPLTAAVPKPKKHPVLPKPKTAVKPQAPKAPPAAAPGGSGNGGAAARIKRPLTSYILFCNAKRSEVKAAHPELDAKGLLVKLGELFKALSPEEKAPFEEAATAEKERYRIAVEAAGGAAAVAAAVGPKKKRTKSAYQIFCDARLPQLRAVNPQAGMGELSKLLSAGWKDISAEDKAEYEAQAKALKEAAKAAAAADASEGGPTAAAPKAGSKKRGQPAGKGGPSRKKAKGATPASVAGTEPGTAEDEEDEEVVGGTAQGVQEEDLDESDDEAERMACDWDAHPAERILSHTTAGKYVVLRRGLGFEDYGLVDMAAVKAQRLGPAPVPPEGSDSTAPPPCPVSLSQLEEYEAYCKAYKREVHDNTEGGALVLSDLPPDSLLTTCLFLGKMREPTYELAKAGKNDPVMKVPLLATTRLMQRMVMAERERAAAAEEECAALRRRVAELEGAAGSSGGQVAVPEGAVEGKAHAITPGAKAREQGIEA